MTPPRIKLVLTTDDHVGPLHNININFANLDVLDDDTAAVLLPAMPLEQLRERIRVRCTNCDCVLLEREDFEFEEVEAWR